MTRLGSTTADLARIKRHMDSAMEEMRQHRPGAGGLPGRGRAGRMLERVTAFGANPGALDLWLHVPERLAPQPALVVALHGCGQQAAGYDEGAGWSTLADRYGFVLVLPQQSQANNPNGCFNWYTPEDTTRGSGEAASIRAMIAHAAARFDVPPERTFVVGLSAGGAMAGTLLATYPELFAGGAIVAGLPYGAAANLREAMDCMFQDRPRPGREWGNLVRRASPHRGPWPRVSVWHGDADAVVRPHNAVEVLKQWTDVHGVGGQVPDRQVVDGFPREVWRDAAGREVVEFYTIAGMGHGVPIAVGTGETHFGASGAFMLDVGISSSYHIARFWGLTADRPAIVEAEAEAVRTEASRPEAPVGARSGGIRSGEILPPERPGRAEAPKPEAARADSAKPDATPRADTWWEPGRFAPDTMAADVMHVIDKALRTAGLR